MKRFVIGDIHGRYDALIEVFQLSNFNYETDKLIILGDIADGGIDSYKVVEELLKIKNYIFCIGNHDIWLKNHFETGIIEKVWYNQGGKATIESYKKAGFVKDGKIQSPETHLQFFRKAHWYHIEDENKLFVHGGIEPDKPISQQQKLTILWDRELIKYARKQPIPNWEYVFVGHTTTQTYKNYPNVANEFEPIKFNNLYIMDCGAGWDGKLAIMNIDTFEFYTSKKQTPVRNPETNLINKPIKLIFK